MLDGATAAYPVYGAMVQELYKGLDSKTVEQYVTCSNTGKAYQRLINGEIDIFFGAQPSRQQMEEAKEKGVELSLTPIAKEAFVFFVNKDNPVNSLTLEQIQDIYQKKITNWETVGGNAEKIIPFQRPENSGSQTIMLARIMKDKPLPAPLREEYAADMGGIINRVAVYRNYSSSIGYSFRYFATGMSPNENIKLLAINGIAPSTDNIRSGAYPFTVDVYAVTAGSIGENAEKLIQWILSEQGQSFIEICGYIRIE
jgi:phosphate transport system substrate-binding protein